MSAKQLHDTQGPHPPTPPPHPSQPPNHPPKALPPPPPPRLVALLHQRLPRLRVARRQLHQVLGRAGGLAPTPRSRRKTLRKALWALQRPEPGGDWGEEWNCLGGVIRIIPTEPTSRALQQKGRLGAWWFGGLGVAPLWWPFKAAQNPSRKKRERSWECRRYQKNHQAALV